jgi:hypothetical protein
MDERLHGRGTVWMVALVALSLISCGGGEANRPAEAPGAETPAPAQKSAGGTASPAVQGYDCAGLITPQEIDALIGATGTKLVSGVRGDKNEILPGETECAFELPQNHMMGIFVYTGGGEGEGLDSFETIWEMSQEQGAVALAGVGERALFHPEFRGGPRVVARVRGRGILVDSGAFGDDKLKLADTVKKIATTVAGRV